MATVVRLFVVGTILSAIAGCPGQSTQSVVGVWDGVSYAPDFGNAVTIYVATFHLNGTVTILYPARGNSYTFPYIQNGFTVRILGDTPVIDDQGTGAIHITHDTLLQMSDPDYMYGDTYQTVYFESGAPYTLYSSDELYRR